MSNTINWKPHYGIHLALVEAGESQKDLAQRLGWSEPKVSKIVSGKQRILVDELEEIAEAQGKDFAWYLEPPTANNDKGVYLGSRYAEASK